MIFVFISYIFRKLVYYKRFRLPEEEANYLHCCHNLAACFWAVWYKIASYPILVSFIASNWVSKGIKLMLGVLFWLDCWKSNLKVIKKWIEKNKDQYRGPTTAAFLLVSKKWSKNLWKIKIQLIGNSQKTRNANWIGHHLLLVHKSIN